MNDFEGLELYLIRNSEGKWLRAKGYGGGGDSWVDSPNKAKIYGKLSTARSQVTFWASHYPQYPAPDIVRILASGFETMAAERERAAKAVKKKKEKAEKADVLYRQQQLKQAKENLERYEKAYAELKEREV